MVVEVSNYFQVEEVELPLMEELVQPLMVLVAVLILMEEVVAHL